MIYLSPTTNIPEKYNDAYGFMFSAIHPIGGLESALIGGKLWMMDNNAFNKKFQLGTWLDALVKYSDYAGTCLGIPVPDVVGDHKSTIDLFYRYYRAVSACGLPVAFVTQDGLTPEETPWKLFSTLFVGGTDQHKLSTEAGALIAEAKRRGKLIHVGRVNSATRLKDSFWMVDSVDGTGLIKAMLERKDNGKDKRSFLTEVMKIYSAVHFCRKKKGQGKLL
jgi:hypothetical protein